MARIIPNYLDPETDRSERTVAESLRELPDHWIAYHSVGWTQKHGGLIRQGEVDFVLLSRKYGLLAVEVKGGSIACKEGVWTSKPFGKSESVRIKDPIDQANRNMWAIKRVLQEAANLRVVPIGQLTIFPGGEFVGDLGVRVDDNLVVTKSALQDSKKLEVKLLHSLVHQQVSPSLSSEEWDKIESVLAPMFSIESALSEELSRTAKGLNKKTAETIKLTFEQIGVLSKLWSKPRVGVIGTAGTGKTLLALEQAKRISELDCKVLLISGRGPLLQVIESELINRGASLGQFGMTDGSVSVSSPAKLIFEISKATKIKASPGTKGSIASGISTPEQYVDWLDAALEHFDTRFDALIVDESQDIEPLVFGSLLKLLKEPDKSPVWFFFDPVQSKLSQDWQPPIEAEFLPLSVNCRNSVEVQQTFMGVPNLTAASPSGIHGPATGFRVVKNINEFAEATQKLLVHLRKSEITNDEIVIISNLKRDGSKKVNRAITTILDREKLGVRKFSPDKFKGKESKVVILWLRDGDLKDDDWTREFYVAASRAISQLYVFGTHAALSKAKSLGVNNDD
jgi:hypothetical protein